jgi:hypothetical protein
MRRPTGVVALTATLALLFLAAASTSTSHDTAPLLILGATLMTVGGALLRRPQTA